MIAWGIAPGNPQQKPQALKGRHNPSTDITNVERTFQSVALSQNLTHELPHPAVTLPLQGGALWVTAARRPHPRKTPSSHTRKTKNASITQPLI
jgi:hypothetical protein